MGQLISCKRGFDSAEQITWFPDCVENYDKKGILGAANLVLP